MCSQTLISLLCKTCGVKYSCEFDVELCRTVKKKSDWGHCGLGRLMPDREEIGEGECTKCLKEIRELEEERKLLDTLLVDDEDLWIQ
ncbi:Uncharacterized protein HZ326_13338 [Fusarium oxysporum f. sp. albedinis]|nr:Uncharacterized protein HZ326_13338 [Fusarium oxysporum f. sp. albedinis]